MRNILPPSPFRSIWTFLVYCLTLSTPVWKLLSFLGIVDLIATYDDSIGAVLAHPLGMWIPVAVGFALLMLINYRERHKTDEGAATRFGSAPPQSSEPEVVNAENEQLGENARRDEHLDKLLREAEPEVEELRKKKSFAQNQNDQRRAMIESWRYFFENYDYAEGNVRDTATYTTIRYTLSQEALVALGDPLAVNVEIDSRRAEDRLTARGVNPSSIKSILLDEVARIERQWDLI